MNRTVCVHCKLSMGKLEGLIMDDIINEKYIRVN